MLDDPPNMINLINYVMLFSSFPLFKLFQVAIYSHHQTFIKRLAAEREICPFHVKLSLQCLCNPPAFPSDMMRIHCGHPVTPCSALAFMYAGHCALYNPPYPLGFVLYDLSVPISPSLLLLSFTAEGPQQHPGCSTVSSFHSCQHQHYWPWP